MRVDFSIIFSKEKVFLPGKLMAFNTMDSGKMVAWKEMEYLTIKMVSNYKGLSVIIITSTKRESLLTLSRLNQ